MHTDKQLLALYGLKYNPFTPDIPPDAIWSTPTVELFLARLERLAAQGGIAALWGDVGLGKSKNLQLAATRLARLPELTVGVMQRPQSNMSDFYRELGDLFNLRLNPANRYGGFKALRERWEHHIKSTLMRPILLLDEAQLAAPQCLTELRLLASDRFDSRSLLTIVLCGDTHLPDRFRLPELLPMGSRITVRLIMEPYTQDQCEDYLRHLLSHAGAPHLLTPELIRCLAHHSAGNLRQLTQMANEMLVTAAANNLPQLDEQLFLKVFELPQRPGKRQGRSS
jgi:type II secretory pathway predicted ATPase ExeA